MDASQKGRPPDAENANGQDGQFLTGRGRRESTGRVSIGHSLVKQLSHMVAYAERLPRKRRAWSLVQIAIGIWCRRAEIQSERRGAR